MSQSKLQLDNAAARALADLSSNIQARSQPSTPQNERRKTPKTNIQPEEHPPILDLLLSTRKPKSKLRQMAEKSARKYKRNSLVPSHDQSTDGLPLVEHTFDLGIPSAPIFDTELASKATNRTIRRRSSISNRKPPLTTSKNPNKPVVDESFEMMLKDLKITGPSATQRKSRRITIVHHISSSSEENVRDDLKPGVTEGEVCETKECNGEGDQVEHQEEDVMERPNLNVQEENEISGAEEDGIQLMVNKKGKKKLILSDSDGDDDQPISNHHKVQVKIPDSESEDDDLPPISARKPSTTELQHSEIDQVIPNHNQVQDSESQDDDQPISKHKSHIRAEDSESEDDSPPIVKHKSHTRIPSSDSEAEEAQSSNNDQSALKTKGPESPHDVSISFNRRQQPHQSRRGVVLEIDSSDSDDSIKISPTRRARFNAERAKMLATISRAGPSQSVLEPQPTQKPEKSMTTKQANLINSTSYPTQPKTVQPSTSTTQPKTSKPRAPRSAKSTTTKNPPATTKREIPFSKRRDELADRLIERLNNDVFDNMLPSELDLVWSNRLNTTAGKAKWSVFKDSKGKVVSQKVVIELGTKVVDSESKLMNTLAHELCHVATWIIDCQKDEKHGRYFKAWASKIHKLIPEIHVTTKHTYEIDYKFNWTCATPTCSQKYGRHSNSIKPDKQMCICGGTLVPVPRVRKRAGAKQAVVVEESQDDDEDEDAGLAKMMGNLVVKPTS